LLGNERSPSAWADFPCPFDEAHTGSTLSPKPNFMTPGEYLELERKSEIRSVEDLEGSRISRGQAFGWW
jgi:hypothetical protein